jgi:L-asparagine oxygenase
MPLTPPTVAELACITRLARELSQIDFRAEPERYVQTAQIKAQELPSRYRAAFMRFKRFGSPHGGLLVPGMPVGKVPDTPSTALEAIGLAAFACAVFSLFAALLGDQFGFKPELGGLIMQAIVPEQGAENTQRSVSSLTELYQHCETVFTEHRADYIGLCCVRGDHLGVTGTTLAPVEVMLDKLSPETIEILRQPRFTTTVDESFLLGSGHSGPIRIGNITVLSRTARARLRVDFNETRGIDLPAQEALAELWSAARASETTVKLATGYLLFIENHHAVHGRTPFTPRWDGRDRWLVRTFVTRDLSRSRDVRPDDGRIIDTDYSVGPDVMIG